MEPLAPGTAGAAQRAAVEPNAAAKSAGPVPADEAGVSFFARALKPLGGGSWLFAADGKGGPLGRFAAAAPFPLGAGDLVRASADLVRASADLARGASGAAAFRILSLESGARAAGLRSLGVVPDAAALVAAAASRVLGLPLDGPRVRRLAAAVREAVSRGGLDEESAALAAAAADDRSLRLSSEAVRAVAFGAGSGSSSRDRDRRRGDERRPTAAFVREAVSSFQASDHPLAFMNAASPRRGKRWIAFPLDFSRGSVDFRAYLRLLLNPTFSDPSRSVEHFVLDVEGPKRFWSFSACCAAAALVVRADPPLASVPDGLPSALAEAFAPLGWTVELSAERAGRALLPLGELDPPAVYEEA